MGEAGGVGLGLALSLGLGRLGLLPTDMPDEVLDEVGGADAALDAGDESAAGIAKTAEGTVEGIIEGTDLLPFFSFIWPEEAGSRRPPTGRRLGRSKRDLQPRPVASWGSWQLALLSMLSPRGWRRSVVRTQALLEPGRFHCYRTLYIGHAGFFPHFNIESEWRAAVPRVARFRSALLAHAAQTRRHARPAAGLVGPARLGGESSPSSSPAAPSILFVLRRGYRCIANEDELSRDVRGDWRLAGHVAFVRMDELSLLEQLRLSSGAKAIGGVHGQGLVWTALLAPTTARGCALLELQPNAMARTNSHSKYDYYRWSKLASCGYLKLVFPDSAECAGKYFRNCGNLTADATEVRTALWRVLAHVRRESALADVSMT